MSSTQSPFVSRHIGPRPDEIQKMLDVLGFNSLDELTAAVVPSGIAESSPMKLPSGLSEEAALEELQAIAAKNRVMKSFIGAGYYNTHTPKKRPPSNSNLTDLT